MFSWYPPALLTTIKFLLLLLQDSPISKERNLMKTSSFDFLHILSGCGSLHICCQRKPLWWQPDKALIYEYSSISLGIISWNFFFFFYHFCLVLSWDSGLAILWFLVIWALSEEGSLSWCGPHVVPVMGWPLPQVLCLCCSKTSCMQADCRLKVLWLGWCPSPAESLAWLQ